MVTDAEITDVVGEGESGSAARDSLGKSVYYAAGNAGRA